MFFNLLAPGLTCLLIIYTAIVRVTQVSDYRTLVSGVTAQDLHHAIPFKQAQQEIADIIKDRTLVGHGLSNDFEVCIRAPAIVPQSHISEFISFIIFRETMRFNA